MKQNIYSPFILIAFYCIVFYQAQAQPLERFPNLYGSYKGQILKGKNNSLFYITENNCPARMIYRSIDEGNQWTKIVNVPFDNNSRFETGADGKIFVANGNIIYYSEDLGDHWMHISVNSTVENSYTTSLSNGNLIAVNSFGIFKRNSNGFYWDKVATLSGNEKNFRLYQDSTTGNVYLCSSKGIYLSTNAGFSWTKVVSRDIPVNKIPTIISSTQNTIFVATASEILKLRINGTYLASYNLNTNSNTDNDICQLPNGTLISFDSGINYYSNNDGQTWIEFKSQSNFYTNLTVFSNGILFARHNDGSIFKSSDNAVSWLAAFHGIDNIVVADILTLTDHSFIVSTVQGYYLTENGGQDFQLIHQGKIVNEHYSGRNYSKNMGRLNNLLVLSDESGIYLYDLNTKTETKIKTFLNPQRNNLDLMVDPSYQRIYVLSLDDWSMTEDLGKTWTKLKLPTQSSESYYPTVINGFLFFTRGDQLYRSDDKAKTWQLIHTFNFFVDGLLSVQSNILYTLESYIGEQFVRQSFDNGLTWIRTRLNTKSTGELYFNNLIINNAGDFFVVTYSDSITPKLEIIRSLDNGQSFHSYYSGSLSVNSKLILGDDQRIYFLDPCFFGRIAEPSSDRIAVQGIVFMDDNADCNFNTSETGLSNYQIRIKDALTETYTYSNVNGQFSFAAPKGIFEILSTDLSTYQQSCVKQLDGLTIDPTKTIEIGVQDLFKCPELVVDLTVPRLRRCFESTIYLSYHNKGTDAASNAYIELKLDENLSYKKSSINPTSVMNHTIRFDLGEIKKAGSGQFQVVVETSCKSSLGATHCIEANIFPHMDCNTSNPPKIKTSAVCQNNIVELFIENISSSSMTSAKVWNILEYDESGSSLIESGSFQLQGNEKKSFGYKDATTKKLFTAEQVNGKTNVAKSQTLINNCLSNHEHQPISIDEEENYYDLECIKNSGSYDPNDITGVPIGIGSQKEIDPHQEIEYTLRFQNTGTDTAFDINIKNDLEHSNLDLSSISFGASSHPYKLSIINGSTLIFSFHQIMLPDSHVNLLGSNGFLKYKIKPKSGLRAFQKIENSASIYFDFNEAVETNMDFHTIQKTLVSFNKDVQTKLEDEILLTPNPTQNSFQLSDNNGNNSLMGSSIKVLDLQGNILLQKKWMKDKLDISIESLNNGSYVVLIINPSGKRIIKQLVKM